MWGFYRLLLFFPLLVSGATEASPFAQLMQQHAQDPSDPSAAESIVRGLPSNASDKEMGGGGRRGLASVLQVSTLLRSWATPTPQGCTWQPHPDKYLLATCLGGKLCQQMLCVKKFFALAKLLRRTLIVPDAGVLSTKELQLLHWNWSTVVDWTRLRACLAPACGDNTTLTLAEYLAQSKAEGSSSLVVDHVHCTVGAAAGFSSLFYCFDPVQASALAQANKGRIKFPVVSESTVTPSPFPPKKLLSDGDLVRHYGKVEDSVLCLGDIQTLRWDPSTSRAARDLPAPTDNCTNIWRPAAHVMYFVNGLRGTLLDSHYAAVHLNSDLMPSVESAAAAIREKLKNSDIRLLYVASDLDKAEQEKLQGLLKDPAGGKYFPAVVSLYSIMGSDKRWLYRMFWSYESMEWEKQHQNGVVLGLVDEYLCARALYFLGTKNSLFTKAILEVRKAEGYRNPPAIPDLVEYS